MIRALLLPGTALPDRAVGAHAGGFDYPTQIVGTSSWRGSDGLPVDVYYAPSLGNSGLIVARSILSKIDALMTYCDTVFGVRGKGGNVIVAPDFGGAYHYGCNFGAAGGDWYESLSGNDTTFGLVMAEVSESYMGLQNKGWNCGGSGGEGLSRFLAEVVTGGASGAMKDYSAGPSWTGRDWISADQGTDQDYPSTGCAVLYCWWLTQLGFTVPQIVQAGEPDGTLASNYAALTGKQKSHAFGDFKAAVAAVGGPGGFRTDNPFNAPNPPYPLGPTPPVPPVPPPVPPSPPSPPEPPVSQNYDVVVSGQIPVGAFGRMQTVTLKGTATPQTSAIDALGGGFGQLLQLILTKGLPLFCALAPTLPIPPQFMPWVKLICSLVPKPAAETPCGCNEA